MKIRFGDEAGNVYETYNEALVSYICLCLTVLISCSTLIFALYHVYVTKNIDRKLKIYTYTLISSLLFNFLYCVRIYVAEHVNIMTSNSVGCDEMPYILLPGSSVLALAKLSLYFFYLSRFHNIFINTCFDFSRKTYKILISSMVATLIISVSNYESVLIIAKCNPNYILFAGAFAVFQDTFWSIFMCICFIQRLKAVITSLYGSKNLDLKKKHQKNNDSNVLDMNNIAHVSSFSPSNSIAPCIPPHGNEIEAIGNIDGNHSVNAESACNYKSDDNTTTTTAHRPVAPATQVTQMRTVEPPFVHDGSSYKDVEMERDGQRQDRLKLVQLCKKMTIVTSTTCISTIVAGISSSTVLNVPVTTTIDVNMNGICILLVFAFMEPWYNIVFYGCRKVCKNNEN